MKKILIAAVILFGCNSSDDINSVKQEISGKIAPFLLTETKGRLLVKETTLYGIEKITEKGAHEFRIRALSDSVIILNNLIGLYQSAIVNKQQVMREFDSMKISTADVQQLISRYNYLVDSTIAASVNTKRLFDSLSAIKPQEDKEKNFYNAAFRVCSFNIKPITTCDSVAFLIDKKLNIISMHIIH